MTVENVVIPPNRITPLGVQITTQTEADIAARVRVDLLGQKIQEQVVKRNDKVSDKATADFYAKSGHLDAVLVADVVGAALSEHLVARDHLNNARRVA